MPNNFDGICNTRQNVPKSERRRYLDGPDVAHLAAAAAADVGRDAPLATSGAEVVDHRDAPPPGARGGVAGADGGPVAVLVAAVARDAPPGVAVKVGQVVASSVTLASAVDELDGIGEAVPRDP